MITEIKMPQLGESVTEGTVGRWLKRPGDPIAKYEPLLEVITDKVDSEVPSPVEGTLLELLIPEGETVRVGTIIARIGAPAHEAVADRRQTDAVEQMTAPVGTDPVAAVQPPGIASRNSYLSPVVARLVAEHGLDVNQISGTGAGGRVSKQDVLRYLEQKSARAKAQPAEVATYPEAPPATAVEAPAPVPAVALPTPGIAVSPPAAAGPERAPVPVQLAEDVELVPLTPMRRAIAEHMTRSVQTAPHVTTVMEVDLSRIISHREQNKAAFERQGVRLTYTPYFFSATALALQQVPVLNGSFSEQGIVFNRRIHIGMAVALEEGLIVPVVRDADERNLLGLARVVNDLAERARSRRLKPDETQGGTFTITNHGVSGSLFATPIINQPQAAILGIGAIVKRPVVINHNGLDAIAIKPMCYLSLTFDHRIADGVTADNFLAAIKRALESYD